MAWHGMVLSNGTHIFNRSFLLSFLPSYLLPSFQSSPSLPILHPSFPLSFHPSFLPSNLPPPFLSYIHHSLFPFILPSNLSPPFLSYIHHSLFPFILKSFLTFFYFVHRKNIIQSFAHEVCRTVHLNIKKKYFVVKY